MFKARGRRAEGCRKDVVEELGVFRLAHVAEQLGLLHLSPSSARLDLAEAVEYGRLVVGQRLIVMYHADYPGGRVHDLHGKWGCAAGERGVPLGRRLLDTLARHLGRLHTLLAHDSLRRLRTHGTDHTEIERP